MVVVAILVIMQGSVTKFIGFRCTCRLRLIDVRLQNPGTEDKEFRNLITTKQGTLQCKFSLRTCLSEGRGE